jgi:hypothetical protein
MTDDCRAMISADADDSIMHTDHVDDCQCRCVPVGSEETKLIDARCITGYSVPLQPPS